MAVGAVEASPEEWNQESQGQEEEWNGDVNAVGRRKEREGKRKGNV